MMKTLSVLLFDPGISFSQQLFMLLLDLCDLMK